MIPPVGNRIASWRRGLFNGRFPDKPVAQIVQRGEPLRLKLLEAAGTFPESTRSGKVSRPLQNASTNSVDL